MYQSILTAGMLLVSTAVLADQPALAKVREVIYQCDQLPQLRVSYAQDGAQASVALPSGKLVVLPARPVASGFLYATPQHSLRGKG
ncbi:MAG: MliC family protein, partial [Burkholderiales bacterium]